MYSWKALCLEYASEVFNYLKIKLTSILYLILDK